MHDDPIDLTPLDPDADPSAEDRFVGAVMSRIAARANPYPMRVDALWGAWSLARPVLVAASIAIVVAGVVDRAREARRGARPADGRRVARRSAGVSRVMAMPVSTTGGNLDDAVADRPRADSRLARRRLAFAAGVMTGLAVERRPRHGLNVTVTATTTDRMPPRARAARTDDAQEGEIRTILVRGRDRVIGVVHDFRPRMKAAMDSTNAEIDAVLTAAQRGSLAAYRRAHPPFMDQRVIKKRE